MPAPHLSPDLVAIIDQEPCPSLRDALNNQPAVAMFGRLITIDVLCFARDPLQMMYRVAAWDQLTRECGG
jgi:hypothetical protein